MTKHTTTDRHRRGALLRQPPRACHAVRPAPPSAPCFAPFQLSWSPFQSDDFVCLGLGSSFPFSFFFLVVLCFPLFMVLLRLNPYARPNGFGSTNLHLFVFMGCGEVLVQRSSTTNMN